MKLRSCNQLSNLESERTSELSEGEKLAKVIIAYGFLQDVNSSTEKIVCPFHDDYNPSLLLNFNDGSWFCFGCNKSGNALSFVREYEKKYNKRNDLDACRVYAKIMKDQYLSNKVANVKRIKNKATRGSKGLYDKAYDYYYGLRQDDWLRPYDSDSESALMYMVKRGFEPDTLNKAKMRYTFNKNYSIIFPMLDNGKFKGWVCRTTDKEIESKRKYLYNEGFSRATTLVGDYGSKDYVFVVEGFMDRLKMIQNGEENVVAILGWKMSDKQIEKLKSNGVRKVISALDNDECGRKGTKYLKKFFDVTRFCYLKGFKDPGEMDKVAFEKMHSRTMKVFHQNAKEAK